MKSFFLKTLIFVLVFVGIGGFSAFFYEIYKGLGVEKFDYMSLVPLVTPSVISVGVLIAYFTLSQNIQNKEEESELLRSSFFFGECSLRLDRISTLVNRQESPREENIIGYKPPLSAHDFKDLFNQIFIVKELAKNIVNEDYLFVYKSRKKDIEEEILKELKNMGLEGFVGLRWGEAGLTLEERIKSWNKHVDIDVNEDYINSVKSEKAPEDITPFPRGILKSSLLGILSFFSDGEAKVYSYIIQNNLEELQKYLDICNKYEYVEGKYILKTNLAINSAVK